MIIAIKHADIGSMVQGKFYESMLSFAADNFKIDITDKGNVGIDGMLQRISYSIGDGNNDYTIQEAMADFVLSNQFKSYAKAHFWTVYKIERQVL